MYSVRTVAPSPYLAALSPEGSVLSLGSVVALLNALLRAAASARSMEELGNTLKPGSAGGGYRCRGGACVSMGGWGAMCECVSECPHLHVSVEATHAHERARTLTTHTRARAFIHTRMQVMWERRD